MSSGVGRGRGWLNLERNLAKPGGVPENLGSLTLSQKPSQNKQYTNLLMLIEQLDPNDDGILLNHKFKAILKRWKLDCNTNAEVEDSFKFIYDHCHLNSALAKKLVLMVSSYSFNTTVVRDIKIRTVFVKCIQVDFENRTQMQASHPIEFHNSICMLTEFYHKARLLDGRTLRLLAGPCLQYLDMLLDSGTPLELELFTTQLYLIGSNLRDECLDKVEDLLIHVRQLLKNSTLPSNSRVWLLLALDISYNGFTTLSAQQHKFYKEELGDIAMVNFQGTHSVLSIETTHSNKMLDSYQSSVSVLKISPPEAPSSINDTSNNVIHHQPIDPNCTNHENAEVPNNREKIGRPILGIGARLQKNQEPNATWGEQRATNIGNWDRADNVEQNSSHWRDQTLWNARRETQQSTTGDTEQNKYRNVKKQNKGWEHDDRFETDYD